MKAQLIHFVDIAPGVRHFLFETPEVPKLEFVPGQFVSLSDGVEGKTITRAYSIASAPDGNRFELCLNRVDEGAFSPHLFDLAPGDAVEILPPLGTFTLKEPVRDSLLIATGTGIAPFRSMLKSTQLKATLTPEGSPPQLTLLFGVRYESHLLYADEFEVLAREFSTFHFVPTLTQPEPNWKGRVGRVQAHLEELIDGRRDLDFYLCGLRPMVDDVRQILKTMGFDRKQIRSEKYD